MSTDTTTKVPPNTLDALVKAKTEGIAKSSIFRVDPDKVIFEDGFNLRRAGDDTDMHIDRLFAAMKEGATIPPIDIQIVDGKVVCRDGHCRTTAAQRLKKEVPEYTLEARQLRGNDADAIIHMLGTGTGGKPLSPLEAGLGYLRLIKMGQTPQQIAAKLGVSRVTIDNGLALAELPAEAQQAISNGEVSSTTAREAAKQGTEGVTALMDKVKENRKSPSTGKKGKKVTAKKLKGTAAAKKQPSKKANKPDNTPAPAESPATPTPDDGKIVLTIARETALAAQKFLADFAAGEENLKPLISALEAALL